MAGWADVPVLRCKACQKVSLKAQRTLILPQRSPMPSETRALLEPEALLASGHAKGLQVETKVEWQTAERRDATRMSTGPAP